MANPIRFRRDHLPFIMARTPEAIAKLVPSTGLAPMEHAKRLARIKELEAMFGITTRAPQSPLMRTLNVALAAQAHDRKTERTLLKRHFPDVFQKITYLKSQGPDAEPNWGKNPNPEFNWLAPRFYAREIRNGLGYSETQFKVALREMKRETAVGRLNAPSDSPTARSQYGSPAAYWLLDRRLGKMSPTRARKCARVIFDTCKDAVQDPDISDGSIRALFASLKPILTKHMAR